MLLGVLVLLAIVAAAVSWWMGHDKRRRDDLDGFAAAREVTTRWALDPTSAPKPVLDIAAHGAQPIPEQPREETADQPV